MTRLLLTLLILATTAPVMAQERETQVPLLPERSLLEIDQDLRNRLDVFPGLTGFVTARLFQGASGLFVLEITLTEGDRIVRERRTLSPADLEGLRTTLRGAFQQTGAAVQQDGRTALILGNTALGLGFYGWAIPDATEITGVQGYVGSYLLAAGGSFLVPYLLTRSSEVTVAHRANSLWGGTRGIGAGWLLGSSIGDQSDSDDQHDWGVGTGVATSILGSVLGYRAVDWANASRGQVETWNVMGDLGLVGGVTLGYGLGLFEREERFDDVVYVDEFHYQRDGNLFALGVAGLSTAAGVWMASDGDYVLGDAHTLRASGMLGGILGLTVAEWTGDDDQNVALGGVAGAAATTLLADRVLLPGRDFSPGQGWLITAGEVAGGLLGTGLAVLIDDNASADFYLGAASAGALIGFSSTYLAYQGGARRSDRNRSPGRFDAEFDLAGLLLPLMNRNSGGRPVDATVLRIRF